MVFLGTQSHFYSSDFRANTFGIYYKKSVCTAGDAFFEKMCTDYTI